MSKNYFKIVTVFPQRTNSHETQCDADKKKNKKLQCN